MIRSVWPRVKRQGSMLLSHLRAESISRDGRDANECGRVGSVRFSVRTVPPPTRLISGLGPAEQQTEAETTLAGRDVMCPRIQQQFLKTCLFSRPLPLFYRFSLSASSSFSFFSSSSSSPPSSAPNSLPSAMSLSAYVDKLRRGQAPDFPADADSAAFAKSLDQQDGLRHLRDEFLLPSKASLRKRALDGTMPVQIDRAEHTTGREPNGNASATSGDPADLADACARPSADIVGCSPNEIVIMNTLSVNLHLMMASFYRPAGRRNKVILEWKPFPSDHYIIESQVRWHGLDPAECMVKLEPDAGSALIPTEKVLAAIDRHADDAALILLPGIQYYSGQLFDMATITARARSHGIVVGWDLAHAVGNVELRLHDWGVDFACWCTYKYLNAGPGSIAGSFVHERHGFVHQPLDYHPRLAGWYGGDKAVRFNMDTLFVPSPGASGFQLSNPSAIDLASLAGALSVFSKTSMRDLRSKALVLTAYLEHLLLHASSDGEPPFRILTPSDPAQRGTQLSLLLHDGLLEPVSRALEDNGVVCDKRKPDVIRVAPVPLYCSFHDVWAFVQILRSAFRADDARATRSRPCMQYAYV
ncbi:hypothetical protein XA68_11498 [Ophiocordyceps unilateralis]|uniref:Kynureninase n=1 Tax=Ophiocordyceps unilateralis TaxID=268505 RepID=A0A2A9PGS7_OPHUN|nr:hypothetical protein XA68_11498 [Ophiocordyceps unilateralis]